MLAAMPLFHGFGLGVCVHSMLASGGRCILIPRFTAKSYAKQIVKYKCNFIAGVPTLYEALLRLPSMDNADLSQPEGRFLRRRQPVHRAEEEVRQVPVRPPRRHPGAGGLRHHRDRHRLLPDAHQYVQGGLHRPALPGHLYQDRQARHRRGGALRRGGRNPAGRPHGDEGIHEPSPRRPPRPCASTTTA